MYVVWFDTKSEIDHLAKLVDEPHLKYKRLVAMDGGNSLKRMLISSQRMAADTRELDSDYFLNANVVDQYANEVRGRGVAKGPAVRQRTDDSDKGILDNATGPIVEGDPTDNAQLTEEGQEVLDNAKCKSLATCVQNWKSAAEESSKKMWAMFEESGIFASACRHGCILWIADMVRSGVL